MKNILYFEYINTIGGVETMFYELAKKYKDYDITIIYKNGDYKQIARLKEYVRVIHWDGETTYECDKLFMNYNIGFIDYCKAKEYIEIIHADYKIQHIQPSIDPRINRYVGVSQVVCDSFRELTGLPCELCYNPIEVEAPKRVLYLLSATRLTQEKGKDRMIRFAQMLDMANIPYVWLVFTNDTNAINNPNVVYMKPRLDIRDYIATADYVVQLSDSEGYCYTILESLLLGVPVITTRLPSFIEMGISEENGFLVDYELSNIDVNEVYNKRFNFKYEPKKDRWNELLESGESTYQEELRMKYKVKVLEWANGLQDSENENKQRNIGEVFEVSKERYETLIDHKGINGECDIKLELLERVDDAKAPEVKKVVRKKK